MHYKKYHYVYRITNIQCKKHYYGTRSSKCHPSEDLGIKYFSSSRDKDFIQDQSKNSQHYKYKIIKIFNKRKDAINFEIKLHNKFDVGVNESFYNKAKQTSVGFDTTGIPSTPLFGEKNGMYGKKHTLETKRKISENTKLAMTRMENKPWIHELSKESKQKISKTLSEQRWVKKDNEHKKIHVSELEKYINLGWVQGQLKRNTSNIGKKHTKETIEKIRQSKLNLSTESRQRISEAQKKKVKCPNCDKICGSVASAHRYHFDNCKFKS